jgi:hypothetical protein
MGKRLKHPTDPEVLEEIIREIRATTREEWIERLSKYPDWDPAWANGDAPPDAAVSPNGAGKAHTDEHGAATRS